MDSIADQDFRFSALEHWVLELLAVPSAPEPPDGSPESVRVFHAGSNYYAWSVLVWASAIVAVLAGLIVISLAGSQIVRSAPRWVQIGWIVLRLLLWAFFVLTAVVTFLARRLNYRLRWYIVTDRSLRIRSGVFRVNELTMTYSNIQEIRVSSGPVQHALGLADLEVQAAGGGGGSGDKKHRSSGHVGRFDGLSNAAAIRDLITERLRHYRDSGLGDTPHHGTSEPQEIAAARAMLDEVRALRASLASA